MRALLDQVGSAPLLTSEREVLLFRRHATGDPSARDQIVMANTRLVAGIANDYLWHDRPSYTFEDAFMSGMEGLLAAVDRFEADRGFKFSTYATHWIRQKIRRAVMNEGDTIRMPVGRHERGEKTYRMVSLDKPVDEGEGDPLGWLLQATDTDRADVRVEIIPELLELLDTNQRLMIVMRYGLDGGSRMTILEAASWLGVDERSARLIGMSAIRKLRVAASDLESSLDV